MQMLVKLTLSCDQLRVFLSIAQILDDQPDPSYAVTKGYLNVSEMETLRQPPADPLANTARGDPTQRARRRPRVQGRRHD